MRQPPATRRACFAAATPSGTAGASRPSTPADSEVDDRAADQLERFPGLAIYRIADLEAIGFEIVPTF